MNDGKSDRRGVEGHAEVSSIPGKNDHPQPLTGRPGAMGGDAALTRSALGGSRSGDDPRTNSIAGIKPGRRSLVPSSNNARRKMLEQPSEAKPECGICDARPGDGGLLDSRPVSHFTQSPADHAGGERPALAVGPGVAPQMHREETEGPGGLLGTVGGAR